MTYYNLVDAFEEKGCPICFLVEKASQSAMDYFLYERVTDGGVRKDLKNSLGFCPRHAWQMVSMGDGLGISIVYEDVLGEMKDRMNSFGRTDKIFLRKNLCPICKTEKDAEMRYAEAFVERFSEKDFFASYEKSDGLCFSHLQTVLKLWRGKDGLLALMSVEKEKIKSLIMELKEFQRKFDWRFSKEEFGGESDSWIRAVEKTAGKRGLF